MNEPIKHNQEQWDLRFLEMAKLVSTWSKDPSTQVGAVIVRPDKTVASVGFNGFPRGVPDHEEWYEDKDIKYKIVRHAEENALAYAKADVSGCTLYLYPLPPCSQCAGSLIQHGIKRVVVGVPKTKHDRLNDPRYRFDLTYEMFRHANVKIKILGETFYG